MSRHRGERHRVAERIASEVMLLKAALLGVLSLLVWALGAVPRANAYCLLTTDEDMPEDLCCCSYQEDGFSCDLMQSGVAAPEVCANDGVPVAWKRPCTSYAVFPRAAEEPPLEQIRDIVDRSFETWTQVECDGRSIGLSARQLKDLSECDDPEYNPEGPNVNSIVFVSDWEERGLPPQAFGVTSVWHNGKTGEILDVDMELNETLATFGVCSARSYCAAHDIADIQNVVTHEAGHYFGLGHSDVAGATMRGDSVPGDISKRTLEADDIKGICTLYPPGSLSDRCIYTPDNGLSLTCQNEEWPSSGCACTAVGASSNPVPSPKGMGLALFICLGLLCGGLHIRRRYVVPRQRRARGPLVQKPLL